MIASTVTATADTITSSAVDTDTGTAIILESLGQGQGQLQSVRRGRVRWSTSSSCTPLFSTAVGHLEALSGHQDVLECVRHFRQLTCVPDLVPTALAVAAEIVNVL
jgi:hypothetical protein